MKIFRVDSIYPLIYFGRKRDKIDPTGMSLDQYTNWIHSLKMYPGDGYFKGYQRIGHECTEHWTGDILFTEKAYSNLGITGRFNVRKHQLTHRKSRQHRHELNVLRQRILDFHPDLIISHEHSKVPSEFYDEFKCLKISRISSPIPNYWNPRFFDGIITDIPSYVNFLQAHKIPTLTIKNPISELLEKKQIEWEQKEGVSFVGTLGHINFANRTKLYEHLATSFPSYFKWYGQIHGDLSDNLKALHQGITGGNDLYDIYANSAIVVNDYIDIQPKLGVNQRIYEAMATGALLITRESKQLRENIPEDLYITYNSTPQMLDQVDYYLNHKEERLRIAKNARQFILEDNTFQKACSSICEFANSLQD